MSTSLRRVQDFTTVSSRPMAAETGGVLQQALFQSGGVPTLCRQCLSLEECLERPSLGEHYHFLGFSLALPMMNLGNASVQGSV